MRRDTGWGAAGGRGALAGGALPALQCVVLHGWQLRPYAATLLRHPGVHEVYWKPSYLGPHDYTTYAGITRAGVERRCRPREARDDKDVVFHWLLSPM